MADLVKMISRAKPEDRTRLFTEYMANDFDDPTPTFGERIAENFQKNIGGWRGIGNIIGHVSGNLAVSLGQPHWSTGAAIGRGLGQAGVGLEALIARQGDRVDDEELEDWIEEQLADPDLPADERKLLESYNMGGGELAKLQLAMDRTRAKNAAGSAYSQSPADLARDRQTSAARQEMLDNPLMIDQLKNIDERSNAFQHSRRPYRTKPDPEYERFYGWSSQTGWDSGEFIPWEAFSASPMTDLGQNGPAGPIVDEIARPHDPDVLDETPVESGLLADLYSSAGLTEQPSDDSFGERVFGGTPVAESVDASGQLAIDNAHGSQSLFNDAFKRFGGGMGDSAGTETVRSRSDFEGDPNLVSPLRRQEELRTGGIVGGMINRMAHGPSELATYALDAFDNRDEDLSGPQDDPYLVGRKGRQALLRGGSGRGADALSEAPDRIMTAIEKMLQRY